MRAGRRVIALDNRGHGAALYDPAAYHSALMAEDAGASITSISAVPTHIPWARASPHSCTAHPQRVRCGAGRLGHPSVDGVGLPESTEALEATSLAAVHAPMGRTFRAFAEQTKST